MGKPTKRQLLSKIEAKLEEELRTKCWICRRTEKELEEIWIGDEKELHFKDMAGLHEVDAYDWKFKICGTCRAILCNSGLKEAISAIDTFEEENGAILTTDRMKDRYKQMLEQIDKEIFETEED